MNNRVVIGQEGANRSLAPKFNVYHWLPVGALYSFAFIPLSAVNMHNKYDGGCRLHYVCLLITKIEVIVLYDCGLWWGGRV